MLVIPESRIFPRLGFVSALPCIADMSESNVKNLRHEFGHLKEILEADIETMKAETGMPLSNNETDYERLFADATGKTGRVPNSCPRG